MRGRDVVPFVDDLQHDVRSPIDHELIGGDVEAHHRIHERNPHHAYVAGADPLGDGPVQPARQGEATDTDQGG